MAGLHQAALMFVKREAAHSVMHGLDPRIHDDPQQ